MNKNLRIFAIIALLIFISFAFVIFLYSKNDTKIKPGSDLAYYEIFREDYLCKDYCLLEYIVQSNGIILEKREIKIGQEKEIFMDLWHVNKSEAKILIAKARNLLGDRRSGGISCTECTISHMFYGDEGGTAAYTVLDAERPDFMNEIESMTVNVIENATDKDDFFIHFVYAPRNSVIVDYHIFSDGAVIRALFGKKNGELLRSDLFDISPADMREIRDYADNEMFVESEIQMGCSRRDLMWGFFEVKKVEKYKNKYTCGGASNASDRFYDDLYNKMAQIQK